MDCEDNFFGPTEEYISCYLRDYLIRPGLVQLPNGRNYVDAEICREEVQKEARVIERRIYGRFSYMTRPELKAEMEKNWLRQAWLPEQRPWSISKFPQKADKEEWRRRLYNFENGLPLDPRIMIRGSKRSQAEKGKYKSSVDRSQFQTYKYRRRAYEKSVKAKSGREPKAYGPNDGKTKKTYHGSKPSISKYHISKALNERVNVINMKTGAALGGDARPKRINLANWLHFNPDWMEVGGKVMPLSSDEVREGPLPK